MQESLEFGLRIAGRQRPSAVKAIRTGRCSAGVGETEITPALDSRQRGQGRLTQLLLGQRLVEL
jgi:hypothetical protein